MVRDSRNQEDSWSEIRVIKRIRGLPKARFAEEHAAELVEVDINPLFALPKGEGVLAVDAVIWMKRMKR